MLSRSFLLSRNQVVGLVKRNIGISAPCFQVASDPIQKLFVDKIKDYSNKSKATGGELFEASPEIKKQLKDEMDKLARQFGADLDDFSKFPTFTFSEPQIEAVSVKMEEAKVVVKAEEVEEEGIKEDDDDKAWFER